MIEDYCKVSISLTRWAFLVVQIVQKIVIQIVKKNQKWKVLPICKFPIYRLSIKATERMSILRELSNQIRVLNIKIRQRKDKLLLKSLWKRLLIRFKTILMNGILITYSWRIINKPSNKQINLWKKIKMRD